MFHAAKLCGSRNLLDGVNADITKDIGIDKGATSTQAGKQVQQAVKVPTPSDKNLSRPEAAVKEEMHSLCNDAYDFNRGILAKTLASGARNKARISTAMMKRLVETEQPSLCESYAPCIFRGLPRTKGTEKTQ